MPPPSEETLRWDEGVDNILVSKCNGKAAGLRKTRSRKTTHAEAAPMTTRVQTCSTARRAANTAATTAECTT